MKERLDVLLVTRGLAPSREKAKTMIMEGNVFVNNNREDKAGSTFAEDAPIEIHGNTLKYVSRGGLKLEKAMTHFSISLDGMVCMDIGASTGGFTDCMLQNGAKKVYSVDVGYGQFAWKLRQDPRVVCMEKTNIRYVTPEDIDDVLDFASVDVSFISLTKVLPAAYALLKDGGQMVCLIKPQFEAGREKVGKKGVVRDKAVHEEVIERIITFALENGFSVHHLEYSPIKGPEGNIEYLVHIEKSDEAIKDNRKEVYRQMMLCGIKSFGVTSVVALFTGMILALQAGLILKAYGQEMRVGFLVAQTMFREMGPFMTALILAASVGSGMAALLGTMKVSQELAALEVMSINPVRFLVAPRLLAMMVMCPVLPMYTDLIGILGGGLVAYTQLGVGWTMYFDNVRFMLYERELWVGVFKAWVFAIIIVAISCHQGMVAKDGAVGVGLATKKSVVACFLVILIVGYIITRMFY